MIEALKGKELGQGCYSTANKYTRHLPLVTLTEGGTNYCEDPGKFVFLRECMRRLRKHGLHSPEMAMLPEVLHIGRDSQGRESAVIRQYPFTANTKMAESTLAARSDFRAKQTRLFCMLHPELGFPGDAHLGNWMYCVTRKQWIMIDPQLMEFNDWATRPVVTFNKTQPKHYSKKARPKYH